MRIAFITGNYPSTSRPGEGTFVQQFVWAMARQGHECTVIKPTSLFARRYGPFPSRKTTEKTGFGNEVRVLRPKYLSFSSMDLGRTHTGRWTQQTFKATVENAVACLPTKPDMVYGHFLYPAGYAAMTAGKRLGIPAFVAVGEGTFWTVDPFGFERACRDFTGVAGFIAVGLHIKEGLVKKLGVPPAKITVEPNGVDMNRFHPLDRQKAREHLGLNRSHFLIAFVGTFDDLKGGSELVQATKSMDETGLVLLGQGPVELSSERIVFKGHATHDKVPIWLNAADVFVLPTREEGSCNAVIEAMACGLPIITSNGKYMDDLVDKEVSIRVDPMDVGQIRDAIQILKDDPQRRKYMSQASLERAKRFDINNRAGRLTEWMAELVRRHRP